MRKRKAETVPNLLSIATSIVKTLNQPFHKCMLLFRTIRLWLRKYCLSQVSSRTLLEQILHQLIEQIQTIRTRSLQRTIARFMKELFWGNKYLCRKKKTRSLSHEEICIKSRVHLIYQKRGFERLTRQSFWSTRFSGMNKILNLRHFAWLITQSESKSKSLDFSQDSTHQKSMKPIKVLQSNDRTILNDLTNINKVRMIDLTFMSVVTISFEKWLRRTRIRREIYQSWINHNENSKRRNPELKRILRSQLFFKKNDPIKFNPFHQKFIIHWIKMIITPLQVGVQNFRTKSFIISSKFSVIQSISKINQNKFIIKILLKWWMKLSTSKQKHNIIRNKSTQITRTMKTLETHSFEKKIKSWNSKQNN